MSCQWLGKGLSIKALLFNLSAERLSLMLRSMFAESQNNLGDANPGVADKMQSAGWFTFYG
jgi:hypothetical protein